MKLYYNVYGHKISDEFDYGCCRTSISWVICPWISKNFTLRPLFLHQFWLYLYRMFITIRSWMSSILKELWMIELELRALDFMKIALFCLVYALATININQSYWNFNTMYMTIRSQMSWIMGVIGPLCLQLSALELVKML